MKQDVDDLDRRIIFELQNDARRSLKRIARGVKVSEGTVRNRVRRMIGEDILKLEARVNPAVLPNKIFALVGLDLEKRSQVDKMRQIEKIPAVTGAWNATGRFDLFFEYNGRFIVGTQ